MGIGCVLLAVYEVSICFFRLRKHIRSAERFVKRNLDRLLELFGWANNDPLADERRGEYCTALGTILLGCILNFVVASVIHLGMSAD